MKRDDKDILIEELKEKINEYGHFYLTDIADLNAKDTSDLRRICFEKEIQLVMVKNTLFKLALERSDKNLEPLYEVLKNNTTVMFTNSANVPAKLIKEFRKKHSKPVLKGAFAEESFYIGEDYLETLATLKSKDELIADVIHLLQSPMKTVLGQLESSGNIIAGVVKTLSERD
jgi:large subunit ribosomal protein L10